MRQIAVVNMKGGTAKTTTAIHVAAGLAMRGRRVLLIDTDPQGNVGHALGIHPACTLREMMLGDAPLDAVIQREARPNLDVITATPAAFSLEQQLAGATQRETLLSRRLRGLAGYDTVVLDSSPAMSLLTLNALLYAQEIVVPVGMDAMSIVGARQTLNGVAELHSLWPERRLELLAVLPTFVNPNTIATRKTFEALEADRQIAAKLYRRGIRQCLDLTYATARRQTIWEYAPRSRAAEDFDSFIAFVYDGAAQVRPEAVDGVPAAFLAAEEGSIHGKEEENRPVV